ncbi:hypothetical protein ACLQ2N_36055, partial [Streptomyces sp. DT224]|uniref:polyketide synthase dehydratase domain-containing protein n=1 Tax=Streptomyces sp. DT224 TaxID=3393426 RepID=UPI003CF02479
LPGAALAELAVRAGDEVGLPVLEELTLQAPLVLPENGSVEVQLLVSPANDTGRRQVTVHSRVGDVSGWIQHAQGVLAGVSGGVSGVDLA